MRRGVGGMTLTSICEARTARRPATSGDVPALPGQDVTPTALCAGRVNGAKTTILVILHYLLKNNITFMGVMCRGNQGGATASSQRVLHVASPPLIGGSCR
ncbi:MAG: hypothetical protein [Cressdnaviricota sp.]|nr:MAG: hypothetical protein [Cressdnaviricota sp.]